jgi:hypothetical protein
VTAGRFQRALRVAVRAIWRTGPCDGVEQCAPSSIPSDVEVGGSGG